MMLQRNTLIKRSMVAGSAAVLVSCLAFGQQVAPPRQQPIAPQRPQPALPDPPPPTDLPQSRDRLIETSRRVDTAAQTQSVTFQRSSLILGANVVLANNSRFGRVQEFVLSDQGCVDYVIVDYQGRFAPVPWSVITFDPTQRVVMLDVPPAQINAIPTFTDFAQFTQAGFISRVDSFYNVQAGARVNGAGSVNRAGPNAVNSRRTQNGAAVPNVDRGAVRDPRRDVNRDADAAPGADQTRPRNGAVRPQTDRPDRTTTPSDRPSATEKTAPAEKPMPDRAPKNAKPAEPAPEKPAATDKNGNGGKEPKSDEDSKDEDERRKKKAEQPL